MGAAAEARFRKLERARFDAQSRPVEFEIMDRLNTLPKYPDAGVPFGPINFIQHRPNVWAAECPVTGFGFWYSTLNEAVRRWNVLIVSHENGVWGAIPNKGALS